jgi:hypothetical protein
MMKTGDIWGMTKPTLAVEVKDGSEPDFAAEGVLDNKLLCIRSDNVEAYFKVLK